MTPPFQGTPTNISINLILSESRVIGLHRRHSLYSLSSFKFSLWAPKDARILKQSVMTLQGHPRSLILAPIESTYATSYSLLIVKWSYLASFQRYCRFSAENRTPPLFHPNFRGVPFELDCRSCGSVRVINFELVQPICSRYINVTDGQTDRRTDGRTTYDSNTALALRASCGKNVG